MMIGLAITMIICTTLVVLAIIGSNNGRGE